MADQDKDGRLSSAEFLTAMALCEAASKGTPIPETLPAELSKTGTSGGAGPTDSPSKRMGLDEERRRNMEKGMLELERRREAIRLREEAERAEIERKRLAEEAEKERIRQEAEKKRLEEEEKQRKLEEAERQRKAEELERQRKIEIEKKRREMEAEKQRLKEIFDSKRHNKDQLQQEKDANQLKQIDTKKRLDEITMRLQVNILFKAYFLTCFILECTRIKSSNVNTNGVQAKPDTTYEK